MNDPRGVTLIELLVVLALLGIMAGIAALAWQPARWRSAETTGTPVVALRRRAAELGRTVTDTATIRGNVVRVIALPDGQIISTATLGVNPLTGETLHGAR